MIASAEKRDGDEDLELSRREPRKLGVENGIRPRIQTN